jgi:putative acetyltransferase
MVITEGGLDAVDVQELLREHLASMRANSPACSVHALDLSGLQQPDVTFWTARDDTRLMGCGALRELDATHGEVKSMRTATAYLRRGVASAILSHLVEVGRARSYRHISLETGSGEAFDAAYQLYLRFGFEPCGPFGDYDEDPFSRYLTLDVSAL